MAMKFGDSPFKKYIGSYATRKRPERFRDFRRVLDNTITPSLCDKCLVSLMMIINKSVLLIHAVEGLRFIPLTN